MFLKFSTMHPMTRDTYCLKGKLPGIIFDFGDRAETAENRARYWLKKGHQPFPSDAA
jgi:hypothetical protein